MLDLVYSNLVRSFEYGFFDLADPAVILFFISYHRFHHYATNGHIQIINKNIEQDRTKKL